MNRVKSVILVLVFLIASAASAKSVGIQVIQQNESQDSVHSSSYLIENTLLDSFFDYGYVVTNSPVAIVKEDNLEKIQNKAVNEALEGQIDNLIVVIIDYNNANSSNPTGDLLSNISSISVKIINPFTKRVMSSKTYKVNNVNASNNSSEGIIKFTNNIAKDIFSVLKSVR